ncbi:AAA family ATPase [Prauserella flavalba]|uniref:Gluconate kinase n=1 Tax=Prauserella flavalba TaxID=1477506 RepID=A0A318LTB8_9PSEU|nr:bifunctional aminoglycoside phosphotransferase/ATP-binding protein [Prauserella flavalba]PXY36544.1 gluconate kinase [Prauserella flavalba]
MSALAAFPDPASRSGAWAAVHETHIGVVFLVGDTAYKLKKPVDLGFLDFTTLAARERACHDEVTLNARLAPDVYRGVADVTGPDGRVCEHLVVMRRMPGERRLSTLVRQGTPLEDTVRTVAGMLARFHRTAARGPEIDREGTRDAIRGRWQASFDQVRPHRHVLGAGAAEQIERLTGEFLAGRAPLFARRIAEGRIVDGHADLLAEDIFCLDDGPRILDCLEFDARLRAVDGLDDVAFLAMDLERLGAVRLGELLLDTYAEHARDPAPPPLRHHFVAYRAFVRAKVACLRHAQGQPDAAALARQHALLAVRRLRAGEVRLILVGGLPGTGKSSLSDALGERLGATVFNSDRVRKELAGLAPGQSAAAAFEEGIYDRAHTERAYTELLRRAGERLGLGETVVLDASWTAPEPRTAAADLADRSHSTLVELECQAPMATTRARLAARSRSVSDATPEIAEHLARRVKPWPSAHRVLTAGTVDDSLTQAMAYLEQ